jgi:FKBP-type peptidyl-prolyl cis-trans isomerase
MLWLLALFPSILVLGPDEMQITRDAKVIKKVLREGEQGAERPVRGSKVSVHYEGFLEDGTKIDSSRDRGQPFTFTLGQGVIVGWSVGVSSMLPGELARITMAPEYAYGDQGYPPTIPEKATLIFEIELLEILENPPPSE